MAGHSKWANIKHRKGAQDAKRSKVFTKLIREITVAAKSGIPDPECNPRLRAAITAARTQNMTRDTIDKAIKRGSGDQGGANYDEVRYEGYGPGGVAVLVDCLTDNLNRTVSEVRYLFNKYGGNMGTSGCVGFLFDRKGQIVFEGADEETLMEAALEAGAEDVVADGETIEVITAPDDFEAVLAGLARSGFDKPASAAITQRPQSLTTLHDDKQAESLLKMIDLLEDNDDVQHVYANFDISDEVMERLNL
ncbi:MAG: YebC/PmpR family DNA-binding transcriptional regulator [Magnetococcales bacterium]|nr:YebC/PmpR family DNA-binding transcriptional regulator [Magnetococcales bacterium]